MSERPAVLIGPASPEWLAALHAALRFDWRVDQSASRAEFQRELSVTTARHVILCEMDRDGIPNAPLLPYCARRNPIEHVILVHERQAVRMPSPWSAAGLAIDHVMLGRRSVIAASLDVAALLRSERHATPAHADPSRRRKAFPVA